MRVFSLFPPVRRPLLAVLFCCGFFFITGGGVSEGRAAVIATYDFSTVPGALDGVSSTDLVNTGRPSFLSTTVNVAPSFTANGMNNGLSASTTGATSYWPTNSTSTPTITFNLNLNPGTGGSATGYAIGTIQSIAGWGTVNYTQAWQSVEVSISKVGSSAWESLGNFLTTPVMPSTGEYVTRITLTDDTGVLAESVDQIRFTYTQLSTGSAPGLVIREIDVFAAAVPEPGRAMLLGLAVMGLILRRRR